MIIPLLRSQFMHYTFSTTVNPSKQYAETYKITKTANPYFLYCPIATTAVWDNNTRS